MITAEFVVDSDVKNQVAATAEVDVLEHQVPPPHLVALLRGGDVAPLRGDPGLPGDSLINIEDDLMGCLQLPVCFLQAWTWSPHSSVTWRPQAQTRFSRASFSSAGTGTPRNWQNQASHSEIVTGAWVRHGM
jgi:hypothetical protein